MVDNPVRRICRPPSSWIRSLCAGVLISAPTGAARADDWLAVLPVCAQPMAAKPELALLYPRPGLPAVVDAGGTLLARVRLPAALTPPPGVQQERALRGFSAQLVAERIALGAHVSPAHGYALPVINLRPDAASSLVYRASLVVPAFAAPGTYSLLLRTPFGERRAESLVRVLGQGETVRLASLPATPLPAAAALATLPVDIWLVTAESPLPTIEARPAQLGPDTEAETSGAAALPSGIAPHHISPSTLQAQPRLGLGAPAGFALRVGTSLLVAAGPPCVKDLAFVAEVDGVLALERRVRIERRPPAAPAGHYLPLGGQPRPLPDDTTLWLEADAANSVFRADNRSSQDAAEVPLLLPIGRSIERSSGELSYFPATDLSDRHPQAIAARWRVPALRSASLRLYDPATTAYYDLPERRACTGCPVTLEVRGAAAQARVAFDLGFARTAFGGPRIQTSFSVPGPASITALLLAPDGQATVLHTELWVAPRRPPSCSAFRPAASGSADPSGLLLLSVAGLLLKRRCGLWFGNRLRVPPRCQHRESAVHVVVHASCAKLIFLPPPAPRQRRALAHSGLRGPLRVRDLGDPEHSRGGHPRKP